MADVTTSDARIEGIVARDANIAVIFRRGPHRVTQMLLWDLNTDEVTAGQWIRARVNLRSCNVTPDGRLLVAGLYDERPHRGTAEGVHPFNARGWTTISRPPYFTALAIWFEGRGLGGFWSSARDLHLFDGASERAPDKGAITAQLRRHLIGRAGQGDRRPMEARLRRDGWEKLEAARYIRLQEGWRGDREIVNALKSAGVDLEALHRKWLPHHVQLGATRWERAFPGGRLVRVGTGEMEEVLTLQEESGEVRLTIARPRNSWGWMDLDGRGRVIYGDRGCLWAWEDFPDGRPQIIADLNAHRFEAREAPAWARAWPT